MRLWLLVFLTLTGPAFAQSTLGTRPEFEIRLVAAVFGAAFTFIESRSLGPAPVEQLALWSLGSLTSLDPALMVERRGALLSLGRGGLEIYRRGVPLANTGELWGPAVADVLSAAWDVSDPVRRAGTQGLISALFEEMLNHLNPYSRYVAPGAAVVDRERRSGDAGAGIKLTRLGGQFVVVSVNQEGPGAEAGIVIGDRLTAVDDQPVLGEDVPTVLGWIAGVEGTDVDLTIRGRDGRTRTVELERAVVPPETVFAELRGTILLLRVTAFSADTDQRLRQELERALEGPSGQRLRGIILDLRGNRGGLLRQAALATGLFLSSGLIATTEGRNSNANHEFRASEPDLTEGRPIVVLVDGRSASAAEIMAAALADNGRAIVVGSSTLGKGLVQTIATLPDGGELFVTWSRVLAPRGWPLQGLGVMPQVCTSQGPDSTTVQLQSLTHGTSRMAAAVARERATRAPVPANEIINLRTPCPAADGRDGDLVAARYLLANDRAYETARLPQRP